MVFKEPDASRRPSGEKATA
ncbi:hypothetical protein N7477_008988 [Penicillium maclennaniae]|nr:hypothetical protein N7477_008988 [Penicillium maclennaniae]